MKEVSKEKVGTSLLQLSKKKKKLFSDQELEQELGELGLSIGDEYIELTILHSTPNSNSHSLFPCLLSSLSGETENAAPLDDSAPLDDNDEDYIEPPATEDETVHKF